MLNTLLSLPKDKRKLLLTKIKFDTKLQIFNRIYTLTEELGLDAIDDYETRVNLRSEMIKRFPDQVFWDYAEHANIDSGRTLGDTPDFERFPFCKVSTRGDVVLFNKKKRLYVHTNEPSKRYHSIGLNWRQKTAHRLVASTFIPRPDRLRHIPYRQLQVNHIDGTRWRSEMSNLEWVRSEENQRHRYRVDRYDEEKYFLFKLMVDNGFKGREFVLSEHDLSLLGITFTAVRKIIAEYDTFKGFVVSEINREDINDIPMGFPADIAALYHRDPQYFNIRILPVIGTVIWGKFKGMTFSLFGATEIEKYFNRGSVESITRGKLLSHYGCTFRRATHREAIPLHGKLTKEIVNDARHYRWWLHRSDKG